MKDEIAATVFFITRLAKKHGSARRKHLEEFAVQLTSILFERYKNHWYLSDPAKGQAFRCIRMNRYQLKDPLLERACLESSMDYEDLGLPKELTVWVDPYEVCCRYGERNPAFSVAQFEGQGETRELSLCISSAVEKATSDYQSGASSDEESVCSSSSSQEPKSIPTVRNPNSVYQFSDFSAQPVPSWAPYTNRKPYPAESYRQHQPAGGASASSGNKSYRPSAAFSGPRVDRFHWVSKKRS
ncbi:maternal B9.10 protein-like [Acipenser oxyrinchus oxyrinchus]|uniref:Maternal B9.10 protein-like n=1 Tax=Acipenser oxyrinchus oxyrinchus TaxID=40147 RepID=A0AAD8CQN7_ACIOX|nr:maternal B9.10 protein-like [Acipenser oxyrinchus oxyrinchus]